MAPTTITFRTDRGVVAYSALERPQPDEPGGVADGLLGGEPSLVAIVREILAGSLPKRVRVAEPNLRVHRQPRHPGRRRGRDARRWQRQRPTLRRRLGCPRRRHGRPPRPRHRHRQGSSFASGPSLTSGTLIAAPGLHRHQPEAPHACCAHRARAKDIDRRAGGSSAWSRRPGRSACGEIARSGTVPLQPVPSWGRVRRHRPSSERAWARSIRARSAAAARPDPGPGPPSA
jgi:hypothetical protein